MARPTRRARIGFAALSLPAGMLAFVALGCSADEGAAGGGGNAGTGGAGGTIWAATGGSAGAGATGGMPDVTAGAGATGAPIDSGVGEPAVDAGHTPPVGTSGCGASAWPENGSHTLDVDGVERSFIVEVPDGYDPNTPYKLVLAWHGFTGTAAQVAATNTFGGLGRFFAMQPLSQGSAIFVAGQGLDTNLLGMTAPGWDNMNGRDVAFARALVEWLRGSYCIDDARIFSSGASYGGYFSNQLGCEMGDVFRAVASMIGGGPLPLGGVQCNDPMAAWITHGTMDMVNAYAQGEASRDHWASVNHCSATTVPVAPADCIAYEGCDAGYPVHFCSFEGGHVIPDFAAEGMWSFFAQF